MANRAKMGRMPVSRGMPVILHRDGSQVGDDEGQDQLGGLQLPNLALAHQADSYNNEDV